MPAAAAASGKQLPRRSFPAAGGLRAPFRGSLAFLAPPPAPTQMAEIALLSGAARCYRKPLLLGESGTMVYGALQRGALGLVQTDDVAVVRVSGRLVEKERGRRDGSGNAGERP